MVKRAAAVEVQTIPAMPCRGLEQVLPFYEAIGFTCAFRQERPNPYAALEWNGGALHLFGVKGHDPKKAYGTCLFIVREVASLHAQFEAALRTHLERAPFTGLPRISRFRPGQSRFTTVDPEGNSIIFIRRDEPNPHEETERLNKGASPLGKAIRAAKVLRDFKNDEAMARRVLEQALAKHGKAVNPEVKEARAMLADLGDVTA